MINLVKMNVIRLFMSKSIYILFAIVVLSFAGFATIETEGPDPAEQAILEEQQAMLEEQGDSEPGVSVGMVVSGSAMDEDLNVDKVLESLLMSGILLMIVGISAVGRSEDERRSGFLKNLTLGKESKKYVFAAKTVYVFVIAVLLNIAGLLGVMLAMGIKGMFVVGSMALIVKLLAYHILLDTAFGIALMAIYECVRKNVPIMLFAVFAAFNFVTLLIMGIQDKLSMAVNSALFDKIELYNFLLEFRVHACDLNAPVSTLVVALVAIVVYTVIGCVVYTKRDVI